MTRNGGRFILAIDQGTTGTTVLVVDPTLAVLGRATTEFPQHYPRPGWVEHDPAEIWDSTVRSIGAAVTAAGISAHDIAGIGITNQRETTVVWEAATGRSIHNAIVWQCRRTADVCDRLRAEGHAERFAHKTGLVLDAYFSGTKIAWLLDHVPFARQRADRGELRFGTIDTYLVSRLSGGAAHVTDPSNASRTLLYDLRAQAWDGELAELLRVPLSVLPEVRSSSEVYATTRGVPGLPDGVPIAGIAGDQQAALFGQTCFSRGQAKCTYGTGAFLLVNTGDEPRRSQHGMLTTVGWQLGAGGPVTYAIEGSAFIAGAAVQWVRDGLGLIGTAAEIEPLAAAGPDSGGGVFVPALAGLGAPHWRQDARGALLGLTRGTTRAHIARAVLEGLAYQIADILRAMADDLGGPLAELRVDGGACKNDLLMQLQADVLGTTIVRPQMVETTAFGAALLAGLATGIWASQDEARQAFREDRRFHPRMPRAEVESRLARWADAVRRA